MRVDISKRLAAIGRYLMAIGLLMVGLGGSFIPWVWREAVALQLTAPGLAEFVKFLPEIRTAQFTVERLYFLGPLLVAMLLLPLVAENHQLGLPRWLRWSLRLTVMPLALAALSPVWTPGILTNAEFRLQTILAGLAIGLSLVAPFGKRLPLKLLLGIVALTGGVAIGLAGWQFNQIQPALESVYRGPVSLGIGWWVSLAGLIISLAGGVGVVRANSRGGLAD